MILEEMFNGRFYPCETVVADSLRFKPVSYTHLDVYKRQALAHATPTQARRVHAYYIAGIKQPEIARREGIHSSKVSVAIHRGLRNICLLYTSASEPSFNHDIVSPPAFTIHALTDLVLFEEIHVLIACKLTALKMCIRDRYGSLK